MASFRPFLLYLETASLIEASEMSMPTYSPTLAISHLLISPPLPHPKSKTRSPAYGLTLLLWSLKREEYADVLLEFSCGLFNGLVEVRWASLVSEVVEADEADSGSSFDGAGASSDSWKVGRGFDSTVLVSDLESSSAIVLC
ncbi:hypothetical protein WICPIJ_006286 [Wickerhamomyces pijperi]|uniref:Uncharacterized protein n=1 Tax=Wickerhamomyces pijperi TaxID=599730 RepID=A0A9P8Q2D9_WICPI|nr:hypothetical protein WICPIJ_006286 [Wickerhamomyces pijperi]